MLPLRQTFLLLHLIEFGRYPNPSSCNKESTSKMMNIELSRNVRSSMEATAAKVFYPGSWSVGNYNRKNHAHSSSMEDHQRRQLCRRHQFPRTQPPSLPVPPMELVASCLDESRAKTYPRLLRSPSVHRSTRRLLCDYVLICGNFHRLITVCGGVSFGSIERENGGRGQTSGAAIALRFWGRRM